MGFDFTLIAPLLPSHCGFSSFLGRGVSSLVKSRVFLSMIVQQPVVILELSQEGVSARPSTTNFYHWLLCTILLWWPSIFLVTSYLGLWCFNILGFFPVFSVTLFPFLHAILFLVLLSFYLSDFIQKGYFTSLPCGDSNQLPHDLVFPKLQSHGSDCSFSTST